MHVHKKRSSLVMVVLMLVLAGALALSASGRSGTGNNTRLPAAQTAGGFGEVYKANPKTLAKTGALNVEMLTFAPVAPPGVLTEPML